MEKLVDLESVGVAMYSTTITACYVVAVDVTFSRSILRID
jgi:hypothetical protein